jgi:hypothetical protein
MMGNATQIWREFFCKILDRPLVKWAQRKASIFLTVEATDLAQDDRVIQLTPEGHLTLKGRSSTTSRRYELEFDLFDSVVVEESKWKVTDFAVTFSISKLNKGAEYWPRLVKQAGKLKWLSCDWNRWIDEDDEGQDAPNLDMGEMDDFPDDEEYDSDDEAEADLDDIEAPAHADRDEEAPVEETEEAKAEEAPVEEAKAEEAPVGEAKAE